MVSGSWKFKTFPDATVAATHSHTNFYIIIHCRIVIVISLPLLSPKAFFIYTLIHITGELCYIIKNNIWFFAATVCRKWFIECLWCICLYTLFVCEFVKWIFFYKICWKNLKIIFDFILPKKNVWPNFVLFMSFLCILLLKEIENHRSNHTITTQ